MQIKISILTKCIAWILILAVLNLSLGCQNYYRVNSLKNNNEQSIADLQYMNKVIILHFEDNLWQFKSIRIENNNIIGTISELKIPTKYYETDPSKINRYIVNKKVNESWVLDEVHIHITQYTDISNSEITFPFESVRSVQIYDKDKPATNGQRFFGIFGLAIGGLGLLAILVVLFKSSCPFIYVFDGEKYVFQGEIFSGSVYPQLERNDYMKLPVLKTTRGKYTLKITNEVHEIQHTNLCELLVFDHAEGIEVLADKNGKFHSVSQSVSPANAVDLQGKDITKLIQLKDTLSYFSKTLPKDSIKDGIVLEYLKPQDADLAKVVIRAKNTFVLDYMLGQFNNLFGDDFHKWQRMQRRAPEKEIRQWTIDQNMPLSLYINKNGTWEFIDYYHIAGPMAFKDDVLEIPIDKNDKNALKIKLEWGANFWEVDYVGVDYSNTVFKTFTVAPSSAVTEKNRDIMGKLLKNDKKYYTQPEVGNAAVLTFDLPAPTDESRSIILHTKGHYQVLRDPSGKPDIKYLETFREPGRFNRFCNEYVDSLVKNNSIQ